MARPEILIVDSDPRLREEFHSTVNLVDVTFAGSREDAQLKIASKDKHFSALCINNGICDPGSVPIIRFAKLHRPATPVYLIAENEEILPPAEDLDRLHIQKFFVKPFQATKLVNAIFPSSFFDLERALEMGRRDQTELGGELQSEDGEMHAISARDFLCGAKCFFDIWIKLGTGRYIKLLKAGDQFDASRVKAYLDKGVTHFFMKKDAQELFLQYCDRLTGAILGSQAPPEMKISQVLNLGKETTDFFRNRGVSEMTIDAAAQFVKHSHSLTRHLAPSVLDLFLSKAALCEHATGTVMILSFLLQEMGFKDRKVIEVVALGGFFHDIGLMNLPESYREENTAKFCDQELAEFMTHPSIGEKLLKEVRRINPLVPQVVLQHHERRDRSGFPNQLGSGAISPIAEFVGICEVFQRLIAEAAKNPSLDPLQEMQLHHYDSFSLKTVEAFSKAMAAMESKSKN